ncbi:AAA family ATPase [Aliidiomarina indica]|uniref:AAA family ATPase n=1 Tax=Aliidiomarina indica TaxID=2749147 RepID=UPI00188E4793|nr:TniB family NTP-binding protein [Aliidiomarina indica]
MSNNVFLQQWVDGNPFIMTLEKLKLTEPELMSKLAERDDLLDGFSAAPESIKRIGLSKKFFVPPEYSYELYERIYHLVLVGYLNRHPKTDDYDKYLHDIEAGKQSVKNVPKPTSILDAGTSMLMLGRSGHGKTKEVDKILSCLDVKGHFHPPSEETGWRRVPQVLWIKVFIKSTSSKRPFLQSILNAIDEKLGSNLASRLPSATVGDEIIYVIKMCRMVGLGMIVVDDVQFVLNANKTKDAKKLTNEFLEDLYNDLCIPMFFIGTPEVTDLFADKNQPEQTERRLISDGLFRVQDYKSDSPTWHELVEATMLNFLGLKRDWLNDNLKQILFYYCEGNVSKLKRLTEFLLTEKQKLTKSSLSERIYRAHCETHIRSESIKPKLRGPQAVSPVRKQTEEPVADNKEPTETLPVDPKVQARNERVKALIAQDMEVE